MPEELVIVEWLKKKAPYNIGEVCGLTPKNAKRELKMKTVKMHGSGAAPKPDSEPKGKVQRKRVKK